MMQSEYELANEYVKNRRVFSNKYKSSKLSKNKKEFYNHVDSTIGHLYEKYGECNFSHIFYDIIDPTPIKKCLMCGNDVMFNTTKHRYSNYCSIDCSRVDGNKIPIDKRLAGSEKQKQKMRAILDDEVLGKEYRKKISIASKNRTPEQRKRQSMKMKEKIANGEFTPCVTNSWNNWSAKVGDKKFRSRFEAIFYAYCNDNNIQVEYEKLRIPYSINGETKNYLVDFIDRTNKKLYEVKPSTLTNDPTVLAKESTASKWCEDNEFQYVFITEKELSLLSKQISTSYHLVENYLKVYKWNWKY